MAVISQQVARSGRGSEFGILLLAIILGIGGYTLSLAGINNGLMDWYQVGKVAAASLALVLCAHFILRKLAPYADPVLLPIVITINGLGLVMINRLDIVSKQPFSVRSQLIATAVGIFACLFTIWIVKDHRLLSRFTYISMVVAFLLLLSPIIPGIGAEINNARIWIRLPLLGTFQPAELAKIFLAIFFAGYLTDQRDNLALAGPKFLGLQLPRIRHFGPILLVWLMAVAVLVLQTDLGTSVILFGLFVSMLYVATNRLSWVVIGFILLALAAVAAVLIFPHVTSRFDVWIHAFDSTIYNRTYGSSQQLVTGLFGLSAGGILGTGWGQGMPYLTPISYSDYIFTSLGEELGLTGALAILSLYLLLVMRGLRAAYRVRDGFGALLAAGLSFSLALQVFVVVGGVTRLIPVTGLTIPFVAHGGSALVCNWLMLAILLRISDATRKPGSGRHTPTFLTNVPTDFLSKVDSAKNGGEPKSSLSSNTATEIQNTNKNTDHNTSSTDFSKSPGNSEPETGQFLTRQTNLEAEKLLDPNATMAIPSPSLSSDAAPIDPYSQGVYADPTRSSDTEKPTGA